MKMYILIKESIPIGFAMVAVAHASLAAYLKYQHEPELNTWLAPGQFRKVICRVTEAEFEKAKTIPDCVIITESALEGCEVALAFKPREDWPKSIRSYKLYK